MSTSNFGSPTVISGSRGTRAEEEADERRGLTPVRRARKPDLRAARRSAAIVLARDRSKAYGFHVPVYESDYSRLMVQVTSPREFSGADGRKRDLPGVRAKFNFGFYTPASPWRRGSKEDIDEVRLIVEALDAHPKIGLGKLFWRAEDRQAQLTQERYEDAIALLASDPELKQRFLQEVSAEEMDRAVTATRQSRRSGVTAQGRDRDRDAAPTPDDERAARRAKEEAFQSVLSKAEREQDRKARRILAGGDDELPPPGVRRESDGEPGPDLEGVQESELSGTPLSPEPTRSGKRKSKKKGKKRVGRY